MPYLHDDELDALHKTINNTKLELVNLNRTANDSKRELAKVTQDLEYTKATLKSVTDAKEKLTEDKNELEEETKQSIDNQEDAIEKAKKSARTQNILLSCIAGIALAFAYYFYNSGGSNSSINIDEIKQLEATRILDSINSSSSFSNNSNTNNISIDDSIGALKGSLNGETIYSVQVGAFNKNSYSLLSKSIAGMSSSSGDLFKYSIGLFKTLGEAQDFRRELVKLGFRDAFVASYIDGVRQEIEHPN